MTFQFTHRRSITSGTLLISVALISVISGCQRRDKQEASLAAAPSASEKSAPKSPAKPTTPQVKGFQRAVGPQLIIEPGIGVSAIRFGTNLETLHRHMEGPCDIQTETKCIYIRQAAEFTLSDGVVSGMKLHRRDRLVSNPKLDGAKYYGSFNGGMRPKIMFGLYQHIVIEEFGEPLSKEPLSGSDGQVERHLYKGVALEYDKLENQHVVLSGIEVLHETPAQPGIKAESGTPAQPQTKSEKSAPLKK